MRYYPIKKDTVVYIINYDAIFDRIRPFFTTSKIFNIKRVDGDWKYFQINNSYGVPIYTHNLYLYKFIKLAPLEFMYFTKEDMIEDTLKHLEFLTKSNKHRLSKNTLSKKEYDLNIAFYKEVINYIKTI